LSLIKPPSLDEIATSGGTLDAAMSSMIRQGLSDIEIARKLNIPFHLIILIRKHYKINNKVLFKSLTDHYDRISSMSSIKGKRTEVSRFLYKFPISYEKKIRLILGEISDIAYGVGEETILEALRLSKNKTKMYMEKLMSEYGEVGEISVLLSDDKKPELLLDEVYYSLREIPNLGRNKTILAVSSLFEKCNKEEAKYLSRLLRKRLYLHLPTQTVINSICKMLRLDPDLLNEAILIKGEIPGLLLARKGNKALDKVKIRAGQFIEPQLCYTFDRKRVVFPCRVEFKYDGWRVEVHKIGNKVILFSRTGKVMNRDYPTVVRDLQNIKSNNCISDGEIVGIENNRILPLYEMVKRKDNKSIILAAKIFDVLYHNIPLIGNSLAARLEILRQIIPEDNLAEGVLCKNYSELMSYYDKIVQEGNEGIVVKDIGAKYYPAKRNKSWLKLKKSRDSLDVVITKAKYGSGLRGGLLTSYRVAVKDDRNKILWEIGDVGNLDQDSAEILAAKINSISIRKDKEGIIVRPSIVMEISFFDVIRSKEFNSGYSLRNPSFIRIRSDKIISQIDTIKRIKELYSTK